MIDKKYDHTLVEKNRYNNWKEKGYFETLDKKKEPFCIVIPPPNVTGKLHIGHAYDTAIQDIIIRFKRMQGYDALWLPGMDHAAIATESKVVKKLKDEGINKYEYGREKFLEACWDWTHLYGNNIRDQWAKLGLSLDYRRERFTLDEGLNNAVTKVFVDYYNKGLIYRGERIINWDPQAQTALSNEEVIYKDVPGAFYHIKYFIEGTDEYLDVATTRPETLFGDTAVAVNANDKRYQKYVGKNVLLPMVNKLIPIITDEHADPEFGTGVVKITPAHDPNDFEVGNRHNLERIVVINKDGTMNKNALEYEGMTREECREALIKDLEKKDLLIRIEPMTHSVGHSERTGVMVEPYLSKQWFVKMKPLAMQVLENQKNKDTKVNFFPSNFEKIMNHWMEITYDWCISRQLWWGHRIPAWYKGEEVYVGMNAPEGEGWIQDNDVLDTWFSSALWPFSTLGWPQKTNDFLRYFPNNCLVTGYDIIPFWVNRMTFQSLELTGKRPFKDCVIHGLIRDKEGRKMSKSLGNGIDPMDMCDKYGADALRYYLTTDCAMGTDLRFDEVKLGSTWNFINKLWNASRFVLLNIEDLNEDDYKLDNLNIFDKWILTELNEVIKVSTKHMEKYEFNVVAKELYSFIWDSFCDSYIEFAKFNMNDTTKSVLLVVLKNILKLLHPFMPYVTDNLYETLPIRHSESIMISNYPTYHKEYVFKKEANEVLNIINFITTFRNVKTENNIGKDFKVVLNNDKDYSFIAKILKFDDKIVTERPNIKEYVVKSGDLSLSIYFEKEVTLEDKELLEKQRASLESSIERRKKLLANENYVNKAPKSLVEEEKKKLKEEEEKLALLK